MNTHDVDLLVIAAALAACVGGARFQVRCARRDADVAFHLQTGLTLTYLCLVPEVYAEAPALYWLTVLASGTVIGLWGLSLWCRCRTRAHPSARAARCDEARDARICRRPPRHPPGRRP